MNCGEPILVKNAWGEISLRIIAQCGDRFMLISNGGDHRNGYMLPDWPAVLRELVSLAVPAAMVDKTYVAESTANGLYTNYPLVYPLSVKALASLLAAPADEVAAQLDDLKVQVT